MKLIGSRKFLLAVGALFIILPVCVEGRIFDGTWFRRFMDLLRGRMTDSDNEDEATEKDNSTAPVVVCNKVECAEGEYCCNESCSMCVKEGDGCTEQFCLDDDDIGTQPPSDPLSCNQATCAPDEYCCNPSCSLCVPLNETCTMEACDEYDDDDDAGYADDDGDTDDTTPIDPSLECKVDTDCPQPYCFAPPCFSARCIDNVCVYKYDDDTPTTKCGPTECIGTDVCCNDICGVCIPPGTECPMVKCKNPKECGTALCGDDEYCCNESCSICARLVDGEGCNKMLCNGDGDKDETSETTPDQPGS